MGYMIIVVAAMFIFLFLLGVSLTEMRGMRWLTILAAVGLLLTGIVLTIH